MAGGFHDLRVAVKAAKQKLFERGRLRMHGRTEAQQRTGLAGFVSIGRRGSFNRLPCSPNHVIDLGAEHAAYGFVKQAARTLRLS